MLRFKKRIRLLVEQRGNAIEYSSNGSLHVRTDSGSATINSQSHELMVCAIDLCAGQCELVLPETYVFDVVDRLRSPHLAPTLLDYPKPPILQLNDYLSEEQGLPFLVSLQEELLNDASLDCREIGGNRILAEYYRGVLVLRDDLVLTATNVIDFGPSSPLLA